MTFKLQNTIINKLQLGNVGINKVYLGAVLVFQRIADFILNFKAPKNSQYAIGTMSIGVGVN